MMIINTVSSCSLKSEYPDTLQQKNVYTMEVLDDPAVIEGLAGTFFGKQGPWFIMAGGSSFPEGKPWEKGVKHFSNRVFIFSQHEDGSFHLIHRGNDMPVAMAEGAYASLPGGLLCVGGQTPDGITEKVWLLSFDGSYVAVNEYPPLPTPVKNSSAAVIGSRLFLVGGELANGNASSQFLMLDLDKLSEGWRRLPDFPLPVSGSAIAPQLDEEEVSLFVFGGRAKNNNPVTAFYHSVYRFWPSEGVWVQRRDILVGDRSELPLSMATASAVEESHILLYGGDDGAVFNQVETALNQGNEMEKNRLQMTHSGFNNKMLLYNTITDDWVEAGETANLPVAVAAAFSDGKNVYIAGGEIRPGVRTPYIVQIEFQK